MRLIRCSAKVSTSKNTKVNCSRKADTTTREQGQSSNSYGVSLRDCLQSVDDTASRNMS